VVDLNKTGNKKPFLSLFLASLIVFPLFNVGAASYLESMAALRASPSVLSACHEKAAICYLINPAKSSMKGHELL
jgi:hypothetical protein